jgi:hypothetical protein
MDGSMGPTRSASWCLKPGRLEGGLFQLHPSPRGPELQNDDGKHHGRMHGANEGGFLELTARPLSGRLDHSLPYQNAQMRVLGNRRTRALALM